MSGISFARVGQALDPPVSRQRAWKIVTQAAREAMEAKEALERKGPEEIHRKIVSRIYGQIRQLEAKLPDLRAAQALLKISCMISRTIDGTCGGNN